MIPGDRSGGRADGQPSRHLRDEAVPQQQPQAGGHTGMLQQVGTYLKPRVPTHPIPTMITFHKA